MNNKEVKDELLSLHNDITSLISDLREINIRVNDLWNNIEIRYSRGSVEVPSQTRYDKNYTVAWDKDVYTCTCPSYKYHSGDCKHIKAVKEGDY